MMEAHFVARRHAYWGARWRTPTGIAVALYVFGDSRWFEPLRRLDSSITNSRTLRSADPNRSHIHDERLRVCVLGQKSVFCGSLSSICRARTRPTTVSTGILCFELFQPSRIVRHLGKGGLDRRRGGNNFLGHCACPPMISFSSPPASFSMASMSARISSNVSSGKLDDLLLVVGCIVMFALVRNDALDFWR